MVTSVAPPLTVEEYTFSFSRRNMKFRFQLGNDEWLCNAITPDSQAWCRYADGSRGNLALVCQIAVNEDGSITTWAPEGELLERLKAEPPIKIDTNPDWASLQVPEPGLKPPSEFPQGKYSHWRMCYLRAYHVWRLRDERSKEQGGELYLVNGYRGMLNLNWLDGSTHVFADNECHIDDDGVVHFGD